MRLPAGLAALAIAVLALAACGSSSKSSSPPTSAAPDTTATTAAAPTTTAGTTATTTAPAATTVAVATTKIGQVLVDAQGRTLYRFDGDATPGASTCNTGCAPTWPALTVSGTPTAGAGVDAAQLTTFKRADGTTQVQIAGHPLYMFAGDAKAGDTNGEGIIGKWYAASPTGDKVGDNS